MNLASHPTKGRSPRPGEVENVTYATGLLGEKVTAADYVRATQTAHRLGRQMASFHETYDVLLTPALATLPPKLGWIDMMMDDVHEYSRRVFHFSPFTVWFNLTGQPAIVLPLAQCNATSDGTAPFPSQFSSLRATATRRRSSAWPGSLRRRGRGSIASRRLLGDSRALLRSDRSWITALSGRLAEGERSCRQTLSGPISMTYEPHRL